MMEGNKRNENNLMLFEFFSGMILKPGEEKRNPELPRHPSLALSLTTFSLNSAQALTLDRAVPVVTPLIFRNNDPFADPSAVPPLSPLSSRQRRRRFNLILRLRATPSTAKMSPGPPPHKSDSFPNGPPIREQLGRWRRDL
jgi:hypothetical protein